MNYRAFTVLYFLILGFVVKAHALELPHLIGENMVVQRGEPVPIWGWAEPGSEVHLVFNQKIKSVNAGADGAWRVSFPKMKAGGPYRLKIQNNDKSFQFDNIWSGDVWVCSGQSNMEWLLQESENAEHAIQNAQDSMIRHFKVPLSWSASSENRLAGGSWQVSTPQTAGSFSAVGYHFAKYLRTEVDVPIGLLNSTWGGSSIQSWMDATLLGLDPLENARQLAALASEEKRLADEVKQRLERWKAYSPDYKNAKADWSAADLDESDWVKLNVPSLWESESFAGLDGVAWYRKHFTLSKGQLNENLKLTLARIDDWDRTYLNGHFIGETKKYDVVREYMIDKKFLRVGDNTLAVRVTDTGGGGGIYSDAGLSIVGSSTQIDLQGSWLFKVDKGEVRAGSLRNQTPTALYNKMMHPLFNIPVKGVLWYQGETNAFSIPDALNYRTQFPSMITHWRQQWGNPALPFYWVQLASFSSGADTLENSPWAVLRESQTKTLALANTGMAVTIDVGDAKDIHPRDKKTVGTRLALHALKNEYGKKHLSVNGPRFDALRRKGKSLILTFRTKGPLTLRRGEHLQGFEVAGSDGHWYKAEASYHKQSVTLSSREVLNPVAVRYAWSDNPETANLSDGSGLPAIPFRKTNI